MKIITAIALTALGALWFLGNGRIDEVPRADGLEASKDDTCYEVTLADDSILDAASGLYSGDVWGNKPRPIVYTCPLKMIEAVRPDAEGLYLDGAIFISIESGLMDDDQYAWSIAVHELVHALQDKDGKLAKVDAGELRECDLENDAYAAQARYLQSIRSEWGIWMEDECLTQQELNTLDSQLPNAAFRLSQQSIAKPNRANIPQFLKSTSVKPFPKLGNNA